MSIPPGYSQYPNADVVLNPYDSEAARNLYTSVLRVYTEYITLLEKYPIFFYENLVDFNEARLHEANLNLHTHT